MNLGQILSGICHGKIIGMKRGITMKRKTRVVIFVMFLTILLLSACNVATNAAKKKTDSDDPITLTLAENQTEDYPTTIGVKEFARLVEEKTDGRYKIDVYAGGQLGDEKSVVELVQLGAIDIARVNTTPLTEFNKEIGVLAMPFLFENEEEKWEKLNGEEGQELLGTFDGTDMVGLAYYDSGERSFYNTKRQIKEPRDMKGLKIRVQPSELSIDVVEALGASATPMDYGEVYSSLQTGVIDGAENNLPSYFSTNHYDVSKYLTVDGYQGAPEVVIASQDLWDELSDKDKQIFKEAAMESVPVQRKSWDELTERAVKTVVENGSELTEIKDLSEWREVVQPVYDKYEKQYGEWIERLTN